MKKIFLAIVVLVLLSVTSSSCSKSDSSAVSPANNELFIQYKYNGVVYKHTVETLNSLKKNILGYSGADNTYKRISLNIPLVPVAGTFSVVDQPSNVNSYEALFESGTDYFYGTSGNITISVSNSTIIEGTFQFSGDNGSGNVVVITEGSFRANK